ncbi:MAG: PepSY domain-containing protein, partial [Oscillospiraceae bacterium]|nr:PepSY domain-containing protein [Oscillospiraceae bacterium]
AGVKSSHISLIKCHLDEEDGTWVYELEFMVGANEYDYEIDAVSGDILKRDMDLEDGGHTDDDDQDDIYDDDIDDEDD